MYIYHRFTDRARSVMKLAQQEALELSHQHIATEHILLALAEEGVGVAGNVLRSMGAGPSQVRSEIKK
jgi:ATP-dependent Clp protease ATP-binding subunit ClpC